MELMPAGTDPREQAPPEPRSRGSWVLAGAMLVLLILAAWPRSPGRSFDQEEVTHLLAAASLFRDRDLAWDPVDASRLGSWRREVPGMKAAPEPSTRSAGKAWRITGSALYAAWLMPWLAVGGVRAAEVGSALLVAVAALISAAVLRRWLGTSAPWWVLLFVFGSVTFVYALRLWSAALWLAAVAVALALAWGRSLPSPDRMPELFDGGLEAPSWFVLRWLGVGVLLGVTAGEQVQLVPLVLPAAVLVPRERRRPGLILLVGGLAVGLGLTVAAGDCWLLHGLGFGRGEVGALLDPALWGWNVLYLFAGRHIGLLGYFLPLVLILVAASPTRGRWSLWTAAAAGLLILLALQPFNLYGGPHAVGNRAFLPLFAALWLAPVRRLSRTVLLGGWVVAGVVLWALWTSPLRAPLDDQGRPTWVSAPVARWAPFETTQPSLVAGPAFTVEEVEVHLLSPSVWKAPEDPALRLMGGGARAELLLASPYPLTGVRLAFGPRAAAELEVEGGAIEQTLLRPDGGVDFVVHLKKGRIEHPTGWHTRLTHFYPLTVWMPEAPPRPVGFTLRPEPLL